MPIPDELEGIEHTRRDALVEAAAEASDELMMKYLEGEPFTDEEIEAAVHKGTREGSVVPVFVGSATKNIGVRELLAMIVKHVPSPAEVGRSDHGRRQGDRTRSERPVRGAGLQGHRRPVRRAAHLLPRHQRHA